MQPVVMIVKQIPNYPDYLVSENGDVFSKKSGKIKRLKPFNTGYYGGTAVALFTSGKSKQEYVSRLVLMAFDRMPKPHEVCRHFPDRDRNNNHISNLKWGTPKENCYDRDKVHKTGKLPDNSNGNSGMCKLTNIQVQEVRDLWATGT